MLSFTGSLKIWVCLEPCDLRKGFEGLSGLVAEKLRQDLRNAIFYTIIEACRRRDNDPFDYLRDVFTRMPAMAACDHGQLLPDAWAKARGIALRIRVQTAAPGSPESDHIRFAG